MLCPNRGLHCFSPFVVSRATLIYASFSVATIPSSTYRPFRSSLRRAVLDPLMMTHSTESNWHILTSGTGTGTQTKLLSKQETYRTFLNVKGLWTSLFHTELLISTLPVLLDCKVPPSPSVILLLRDERVRSPNKSRSYIICVPAPEPKIIALPSDPLLVLETNDFGAQLSQDTRDCFPPSLTILGGDLHSLL